MPNLPNLSFLQSRAARVQLARQRFFDDGQAPTGVVCEAVFESWARCLRLHGNPRVVASFQPVTASRTQLALLKNRPLRQAWLEELPRLESVLGSTNCAAMLTDASGIMIGASCVGRAHETLMPVVTRLGVNLAEDAVGTTAPGVAARTGKAVNVVGGEHFFDSVQHMHCAAAPIHDIHGQLAGVLDISSECMAFEFDAAAVVSLSAGAIENRLLVAQSTQHLVLRFQLAPELLDSAMVALVGLDATGRQAWENGVAQSLLGTPSRQAHRLAPSPGLEHALGLGLTWSRLAALPATGAAPLTLPNGLRVWARAEMRGQDGHRGLVPGARLLGDAPAAAGLNKPPCSPASPAPEVAPTTTHTTAHTPAHKTAPPQSPTPPQAETPRLRESDLDLIHKTLQACGGNVSDAALRLGVSRGLIYRRLRAPTRRSSENG